MVEGNFVTLKVVRETQDVVSFNEAEIEKYKFNNQEDGQTMRTTWNGSIEQDTDIKLGAKAITIIGDELEKLNKQNKLKQDQFTIYEKFVENQK